MSVVFLVLLAPAPGQAERLPIKTYTTTDGLAGNFVHSISRDSRGYLWFSTRDGLSRFDGSRFTTYTTDDGLPNPVVNYVLETRDGVLWIATNGGGICRFNPYGRYGFKQAGRKEVAAPARADSLFTVYPLGSELLANRVNVLYEDRGGALWAGTDDGLFRLERTGAGERFSRVPLEMMPLSFRFQGVQALVEDDRGSLWMGGIWGLVRRWSDGRTTHYSVQPEPDGDPVIALLADRSGRLWVGHRAGLIVLRPEPASGLASRASRQAALAARSGPALSAGGTIRLPVAPGEVARYTMAHGLAHNTVAALHQSSDGRIWICTRGGLTEFDGRRFRSYGTAHGLSDESVGGMAEDSAGNLWLATLSSGAMKLTMNGFFTYDAADGLGHSWIHSIMEDESGTLFVVSGNHLISRFDGGRFSSVRPNIPGDATYTWISQVGYLDRAGQWWMLTTRGLYRFAKASRLEDVGRRGPVALYTGSDGLGPGDVFRLFEDSKRDLWVSIRSGGLARWRRRTETFEVFSDTEGLPPRNAPSAFVEDRSGGVWIGFSEGGLARYRDGRFSLFTAAEGVPAGLVTALYLDGAGRLWIGTNQAGLSRVDDPTADRPRFVSYTTAQGLTSNNVRCITEDRWGRIYAGTSRGLDQVDVRSGRVRHFTANEGLASEFVTAAFRDRRGALWFGTLKGLSRLVPAPRSSEAQAPSEAPSVLIGGVRVAGVAFRVSDLGEREVGGLMVEPSQNHVEIDFFGFSFGMGGALRYRYRLEGADSDWSPATDVRRVNYARLSPGSYRFVVRAVGPDDPSGKQASVTFTVLPPLWQQWWFLTAAAGLAGLTISIVYRYRLARLLEVERIRTRIATDLHDDIGSSLSQIAILSEVVRQRAGPGGAPVAEPLSLIASTSRELVDGMSEIVWAINPSRDSLRDLAQRMRRFASDSLTARNIELRFHTTSAERDIKIGGDVRRQVFLIFKESINNVARHSGGTRVTVEFGMQGGQLRLRVSDDGRGFDPAQVDDGNGLMSLHQRASDLGGHLEVVSEAGKGTTLTLTVPPRRRWTLLHGKSLPK